MVSLSPLPLLFPLWVPWLNRDVAVDQHFCASQLSAGVSATGASGGGRVSTAGAGATLAAASAFAASMSGNRFRHESVWLSPRHSKFGQLGVPPRYSIFRFMQVSRSISGRPSRSSCLDAEVAVQQVFIGLLLLSQPHFNLSATLDPARRSAFDRPMHDLAKSEDESAVLIAVHSSIWRHTVGSLCCTQSSAMQHVQPTFAPTFASSCNLLAPSVPW